MPAEAILIFQQITHTRYIWFCAGFHHPLMARALSRKNAY